MAKRQEDSKRGFWLEDKRRNSSHPQFVFERNSNTEDAVRIAEERLHTMLDQIAESGSCDLPNLHQYIQMSNQIPENERRDNVEFMNLGEQLQNTVGISGLWTLIKAYTTQEAIEKRIR